MGDPHWRRRAQIEAMAARILELWQQGATSGQIARELHLTRNAVMGQVHRGRVKGMLYTRRHFGEQVKKGLEAVTVPKHGKNRMIPRKPKPRVLRPKLAPGRIVAQAQAAPSPAVPLPLTTWALPSGRVLRWHADDGCAFYCGEAADPQWCNAPVIEGTAWCEFHWRLTHTTLPPRGQTNYMI